MITSLIGNETNNRKIINLLKKIPNINQILLKYEADSVAELLYIHNNKKPLCSCGKQTKFISSKQGYKISCSVSCASKKNGTEKSLKGWRKKDRKKIDTFVRNKRLKETLSLRTDDKNIEIRNKISLGVLKRNEENPNIHKTASINRQNTCLLKYGVTHFSKTSKYKKLMRNTMENRGYWTPIEKMKDLYSYRRKVWVVTNSQNLETLKNIDKRGKDFHLDHKFSITAGFNNNLPPYIIGNINNLEILPAKINRQKIGKCSITIKELTDALSFS